MTDRTGILVKSPLIYTIASIRFAPWPLMAQKIPEIHDGLRDIAPLIHHVQIQQVGPDNRELPSEQAWMLLSKDRTLCIHLVPNQLLVFSSKYSRYAEFANALDRVLDALLKPMRFIDAVNIGVRYVDRITIAEKEKFEDYVTSKLLPTNLAGLNVIGGVSIASYHLDGSELRVRCVAHPNELAVPLDMIDLLAISQEPGNKLVVEPLGKNRFLLDIDAITNYPEPERKNKEDILGVFHSSHKKTNEFFRHKDVCTEHAFKMWKGEI